MLRPPCIIWAYWLEVVNINPETDLLLDPIYLGGLNDL